MRLIGEILNRVLADLDVQFPQEDKGGIRAAVIAPGHRETVGGEERKVAGGKGGPGFKSPASAFITDHTAPAGHGTSPKTSAGNNGSEVNALELSGDIHDARTAAIQTTTGVAITAYEIQK